MDDPFPAGMMLEWSTFMETYKSLKPGLDWYPEIFATQLLFPLQRPKELAAMIRLVRKRNPRTIMEIGADKGGGFYHWVKCLPSAWAFIGCEVRGTPYSSLFENGFPDKHFFFIPASSYEPSTVQAVNRFLKNDYPEGVPGYIDVLFLDGDKAEFVLDFDSYRPLMNPNGVVLFHDVCDPAPGESFRKVIDRGYKHEVLIDRSDSEEALWREKQGIPSTGPHEAWLRHWRGRSCGVGVVYLGERQ